jgi:hypothetical protein
MATATIDKIVLAFVILTIHVRRATLRLPVATGDPGNPENNQSQVPSHDERFLLHQSFKYELNFIPTIKNQKTHRGFLRSGL